MAVGLRDFTADTFRTRVGEVFVFARPAEQQGMSEGRVSLKLVEVTAHAASKGTEIRRQPFSLLFTLEASPPLGQGLHRLLHNDFEAEEWMLGRVQIVGRDPGVAYYEAVFS